MYELLLTYCYSTKNLRNYDFVCLFKVIFIVKYKRLNCRISGRIVSISGIRPDIKNGRISGPTLVAMRRVALTLNYNTLNDTVSSILNLEGFD